MAGSVGATNHKPPLSTATLGSLPVVAGDHQSTPKPSDPCLRLVHRLRRTAGSSGSAASIIKEESADLSRWAGVAGGPVVGWALVRSPLASPDGVPDAADGSAAFADRDVGCDPHLSRRCRAERKAHSLPGDDVLPRLRRCDQDGRSEWSDAEHGQQHAPDQTQEPHRVRSKRRAHGGASILRGSGALACQ